MLEYIKEEDRTAVIVTLAIIIGIVTIFVSYFVTDTIDNITEQSVTKSFIDAGYTQQNICTDMKRSNGSTDTYCELVWTNVKE